MSIRLIRLTGQIERLSPTEQNFGVLTKRPPSFPSCESQRTITPPTSSEENFHLQRREQGAKKVTDATNRVSKRHPNSSASITETTVRSSSNRMVTYFRKKQAKKFQSPCIRKRTRRFVCRKRKPAPTSSIVRQSGTLDILALVTTDKSPQGQFALISPTNILWTFETFVVRKETVNRVFLLENKYPPKNH